MANNPNQINPQFFSIMTKPNNSLESSISIDNDSAPINPRSLCSRNIDHMKSELYDLYRLGFKNNPRLIELFYPGSDFRVICYPVVELEFVFAERFTLDPVAEPFNLLWACEFYFSDGSANAQKEKIDKISHVWQYEHQTIEHAAVIDGLTMRVFMFDSPYGPLTEISFEEFFGIFKNYVLSKTTHLTDEQNAMVETYYAFRETCRNGSAEQKEQCQIQKQNYYITRANAAEEAIKQWCIKYEVPSSFCDPATNIRIDKALQKAKELFFSGQINNIPIGTTEGLIQIHRYIFDGLFPSAGSVRTQNAVKNGFRFISPVYLHSALKDVEQMPEDTFEHIVQKFVEMNVCHPFLDGNSRAIRIWLDMMLKLWYSLFLDRY